MWLFLYPNYQYLPCIYKQYTPYNPYRICYFHTVIQKSNCCVSSWTETRVVVHGRGVALSLWSAFWMENRILSCLMIYVKTCQSFLMPPRGCFPTEICISARVLSSRLFTRPCFAATSLHGTKMVLTARASWCATSLQKR